MSRLRSAQLSVSIHSSLQEIYMSNIIAKRGRYIQVAMGVFGILDYNDDGSLKTKFVMVKRFYNEEDNSYSHICSCNSYECFHISAVRDIWNVASHGHLSNGDLENEFQVNLIPELLNVHSVYCADDNTYSVVKITKETFTCQLVHCKKPRSCQHVEALKLHFHIPQEPPFDVNVTNDQTMFNIISNTKIKFPYEREDRVKVISGNCNMLKLVPSFNSSTLCTHGFTFAEFETKVYKQKATIHHESMDLTCEIHYRPSTGNCGCHQDYDGRTDHLINVDNRSLFPYEYLKRTLLNIQASRYTLWAAYKMGNDDRLFTGSGQVMPRSIYQKFRRAYNGYLRLLDMDYKGMYLCQLCGPQISTLVCDGISIGTKEKLVRPHEAPPVPEEQIQGSTLKQRMFGLSKDIKTLLAKYCNRSRKGYSEHIEEIDDEDFEALCSHLEDHPSLLSVVQEAGNPCPISIQKLVGELSRESPTCGIVQISGQSNENVRNILENIANEVISI